MTPILNLPQVAPNQNQKETTINSAFAILEASLNDVAGLSLASGNKTLSADEFTRAMHLRFSGATAARTVTLPATKRFFIASNDTSFDITLKTPGSSGLTLLLSSGKRVLVMSDGVDLLAVSAGVSKLSDLSDVNGAGDPSVGQLLAFLDGAWRPADNPAEIHFWTSGKPAAGAKVYRRTFSRAVRIFSDFNQSQGKASAAATNASVFNVYKQGTLVGTLSYAPGATNATFSTDTGSGSTSITFAPGEVLEVTAPASQDPTLSDPTFDLKAVYL